MSRFLTKKVSPARRWNPKGAINVRSSSPRKLYSTFADQLGKKAHSMPAPTSQPLLLLLEAVIDAPDGVLTRNKVTAAGIAINSQLRADEQQLRRKRSGDVMDRLLKIIEEEKKKLLPPNSSLKAPLAEGQQPENVELERSDAEATVMASGGEGSEGTH